MLNVQSTTAIAISTDKGYLSEHNYLKQMGGGGGWDALECTM